MASYLEVLDFWFSEIEPAFWWKKSDDFDQLIRERFLDLHFRVATGEMFAWRDCAEGRLAEVIVLDQFSRNMFRDSAQAFATDGQALMLAQAAIQVGDDQKLEIQKRNFLYMPFMHSESAIIHEEAVRLFTATGKQNTLNFELKHKAIIDRFGRYPHRNEILGRVSTADELAFLETEGSSF